MYGGTNLFNTTGVTLNTGTHFGSLIGQPGFPLNTSFRETVNQSQVTNTHRSMKGSVQDESAVTVQGQAVLQPGSTRLPNGLEPIGPKDPKIGNYNNNMMQGEAFLKQVEDERIKKQAQELKDRLCH